MSIVQSAMFTDLPGSCGYNNVLAQFKARITTPKPAPPPILPLYTKKRSHSDQETSSEHILEESPKKRSRTAPPSPPSTLHLASSFPSALPAPRLKPVQNITLPSLSDALGISRPPKSIVPTVSLDYFDTYKPNDENWRYGLLDTIRSTKPSFSLAKYGYLDKHVEAPKLPSIQTQKPHFDARVSPKARPTPTERKVNFPYESNYTYLNQTYMTDVERYPEYLELAHSLVALSYDQKHHRVDRSNHSGHSDIVRTNSNVSNVSNVSNASAGSNATTCSNASIGSNGPNIHNHSHIHGSHGADFNAGSRVTSTNLSSGVASNGSPPPSSMGEASIPGTGPGAGHPYRYMPQTLPYATPDSSFEYKPVSPKKDRKVSPQLTRFIPITPPSVKDKTRSELMKTPPRTTQVAPRVCISCGSDQSPCWRPSWSIKEGQLCNSCGLRYKKTAARCLNSECKKIPAKGEWSLMQTKGKTHYEDGDGYSCLDCGCKVEVKK